MGSRLRDSAGERSLLLDTDVNKKDVIRARRLLYLSHLFAKGSDIAFQFCLTLFLAAFTNYENLILVSTYGLFSGLTICMLGHRMGKFIDDTPRLFSARVFIWTQNSVTLLCTLSCYFLLRLSNDSFNEEEEGLSWSKKRLHGVPSSPYAIFLLVCVHVFGAFANVLDQGFTVAIEKDWIVVMSEFYNRNHPEAGEEKGKKWLSETNITMTQIDLSCKSLAPAFAGFFIAAFGDPADGDYSTAGLDGAAVLIGALNIACLIVEWICTSMIYNLVPDLSQKLNKFSEQKNLICMEEEVIEDVDAQQIPNAHKEFLNENSNNSSFLSGLEIYMKQNVSWAGISLALLYFNILTFGAIMTAYLVWRGMSLKSIGIWRGFSAVIGLLGTFAFRFSVSKVSIEFTGLWSISFQFICLSTSYISLFINENVLLSLSLLIGGVCASRVGLWVFDITIRQLMQEHVSEEFRGVVGSLQQSLNSFFNLVTFVLGIVFPDPRQFHILVASGYAGVAIALLCYWIGLYLRRDILK